MSIKPNQVDGDYWHKDKLKDRARDEFVKKQGYKILRIRFDHKLPSLEDIKSSIYNLINSEHTFYELISSDLKT